MKTTFKVCGIVLILASLILLIPSPFFGVLGIAFGVFLIFYGKKYKAPEKTEEYQPKGLDEFKKKYIAAKEKFDADLNAIPRVEITLKEEKVKRQALSEMPDISPISVTRKTNIDKLFPLVAIDIETTGISKSGNEIIEVSAIKFDKGFKPVSCFTTLVKPNKPIPEEATSVNHITNEMVEQSPKWVLVDGAFRSYIEGCNILGHNLPFDLEFLHVQGMKIPEGVKLIDTLPIAQARLKKDDVGDYKLTSLCDYFDIFRSDAHRSLSDCYATALVFEQLVKVINS